jgi:hypothetical protein
MYHVLFAQIIHAERERELEAAIRRRHLLRPQDQSIEPSGDSNRRANDPRALTPRARPAGG